MSLATESTRTHRRHAIRPRRLGLEFGPGTPRHVVAHDPLVSRFLDTLSLTFPDGEKFFVESVRHFRDQARDEAHAADIAGFVAQEMQHSLEHEKWNHHLAQQGVEALARKLLKGARIRFTPRERLGATAALEHVTAVLAKSLLDETTLVSLDPSVRPLWLWHAIEEIEHKSVAFDLHATIGGSHTERRVMLVVGTLYLAAFTSYYTYRFLEADGVARDPRVLGRGLWRLWGWNGLLSRALPDYLDFFRGRFHPEHHDTDALLVDRRAELERLRARTSR